MSRRGRATRVGSPCSPVVEARNTLLENPDAYNHYLYAMSVWTFRYQENKPLLSQFINQKVAYDKPISLHEYFRRIASKELYSSDNATRREILNIFKNLPKYTFSLTLKQCFYLQLFTLNESDFETKGVEQFRITVRETHTRLLEKLKDNVLPKTYSKRAKDIARAFVEDAY